VVFPNIVIPKERLPPGIPIETGIELIVGPVNRPYSGDIVRAEEEADEQKPTLSGAIQLDLPPSLKSLLSDFQPITVSFDLTTSISGQLQGEIEGLKTCSASGRLVENVFDIDETDVSLINDALGLPAPPGTNELIIEFEASIRPPRIGTQPCVLV